MGLHLQESIVEQGALRDASESDVEAFLDRLNRWNNNRNGEDPVAIRKALQECMQHNFSVFREGDAMAKRLEQLKVIRERLKNASFDDTSSEFNTQRVECLELIQPDGNGVCNSCFCQLPYRAVARIAASISRIVMMKTGCATPCICQRRNP
ncbi:hypothetical protein MJ581_04125 [Escherichia coli]|nr:hypothetical protein MJ581_04125 [Escherichia coli]